MLIKQFYFILLLLIFSFQVNGQQHSDKIDPILLSGLKEELDYVVLFKNADVTNSASKIKGKINKTSYVYKKLKSQSDLTQKMVKEYLLKNNIYHQSYIITNCIRVKSNTKTLLSIAAFDDVVKIIDNFPIHSERYEESDHTKNRDSEPEWGLKRIQADSVWKLGFEGTGIVVAGEDTGYDWDVEPLRKKYRGYVNDSTVLHSYNWHDAIIDKSPLSADSLNPCGFSSKIPCDDNNHGTHTMGTMVGSDSSNIIGVAPLAKWIGCRNMERGNGQLSTYVDCFEWFLAPTDTAGLNPDPSLAPHVINNSWYCSVEEGCNPSNWGALETAIINLKAAGIVVVVSAGNNGPNCETVTGPPAIFSPSFSVGATALNDTIANFSSRGPISIDGSNRMKPDISAPGRGIRSVVRGGNFATFSGTSMAGPHVAGAVALIINANPDLAGEVETIENILKETAEPKFSEQECGGLSSMVIPNPIYGFGRLNVLKAVEKAINTVVNYTQDNQSTASKFRLFPNPTADFIQLSNSEGADINFKILAIDGKMLNHGRLITDAKIDMSNYQEGLYLIEISTPSKTEIFKIAKI
jgi:subtilisin family serine protease